MRDHKGLGWVKPDRPARPPRPVETTPVAAVVAAASGLVSFGTALGPALLWSVAFGFGLAAVVVGMVGVRPGQARRGLAVVGLVSGGVGVVGSLVHAANLALTGRGYEPLIG